MRRYAFHDTAGLLHALQDEGFAFMPDVLSAEQCAEARSKIDALTPEHWDEVHAGGHVNATGRQMDRFLCVFNRDPYWLRFLDRPGFIELAESALGRDCHVIGMTAWRTHAGFRAEPLHVDYAAVRSAGDVPMFIITVHFYLSDVTPDLAPTRIVPGSHRRSGASHAPYGELAERPVVVLARTGDALVFRSDVCHGGSDNRSEGSIRYLLQVHYGRREMAQHFSPYLAWRFNPDVIARATKRQRRLLGDHEPGAYD